MKKKLLFLIIAILLLIVTIILIDYFNAKYNETKPLIAIKSNNEEQQMIIYYGIFFKTYQCTAEEDHYVTVSYFSKIDTSTFCPKSIKIKFEDGYFINSKNVKIEESQFKILKQFYSTSEIDQMTSDELDQAIKDASKWIPVEK